MDPDRLWAKSWDSRYNAAAPRSEFFVEHLKDVLAAAEQVLAATGDDQLLALGLPLQQYQERFHRIVRVAAALHDLGKANDHFQLMVRGKRHPLQEPQGLRHEWATILILTRLKSWMLPAVGSLDDWAILEWAIAGHHPALNHPSPPKIALEGAGTHLTLLLGHPDFRRALDWLCEEFKLPKSPPATANLRIDFSGDDNGFRHLSHWRTEANFYWNHLEFNAFETRLVAAAKNCLIASDIAGSALPRVAIDGPDLWNRILKAFDSRPKSGDLDNIVRHRLCGNSPRPFQEDVANSMAPVTFVKGGCGSGKTLAAYMWAARNQPTRRLYFCYPTTGTATEGFKDYLYAPEGDLKEIRANLFHSRRDIDFDMILTAGADTELDGMEQSIRIDALEAWSTPIVACTVDTVLGLIQNNRRGLLGWPALAQSAFVFDEIHAYDDRLFGALLRFLRDLPGLPVLLMTASLPRPREDALRKVLSKRHLTLTPIPGPPELETLPRYHRLALNELNPLQLALQEAAIGGKVLWVCNTVDRVMATADLAIKSGENQVLVYHSRFKYQDRVLRHEDVIQAFTPDHRRGVLAVTSQVCEMSLDLKGCTLLITECAPVPSLIQRLGRLNRQARSGDPTRPFVVVKPEHPAPYASEELLDAETWLEKLGQGALSQNDLVLAWEQECSAGPVPVESVWLDGGPETIVKELRDGSPGVSIILESDRQRVLQEPRSSGRFVIPMPPPTEDWKKWDRVRGIPIAPDSAVNYAPLRGASWRN